MVERGSELFQILGGLRLGFHRPHGPHQHHDLARGRMVLLDQQRVYELAQQPPGPRVDAAHDAEVEEHDLAAVVDVQIARMQVPVEQAVLQTAPRTR